MGDLLMDYADETEALKPLKMDVSFQFGRFMCLTPTAQKEAAKPLEELEEVKKEIQDQTNKGQKLDLSGVMERIRAGHTSSVVPLPQNVIKGKTKPLPKTTLSSKSKKTTPKKK